MQVENSHVDSDTSSKHDLRVDAQILESKLKAAQNALELLCIEKGDQKQFYESRIQSIEAENELLKSQNSSLELEAYEWQKQLEQDQEKADRNESILIQRIDFLTEEINSHEQGCQEKVMLLDQKLKEVSARLESVTAERDHAKHQLVIAAQEKVTALVNYAELCAVVHSCLSNSSPEESAEIDLQTEVLRRYKEVLEDRSTLQIQLRDTLSNYDQLQHDIRLLSDELDSTRDQAHVLGTIVEEQDDQYMEMAVMAEGRQKACAELQETIYMMERKDERRLKQISELSEQLSFLKTQQNELQVDDSLKPERNLAEKDEIFQGRLSMLHNQMRLITELAASEFTILKLSEDLEKEKFAKEKLIKESRFLPSDCENQWESEVPAQPYISSETSMKERLSGRANVYPIDDEIEEGQITISPSETLISAESDMHDLRKRNFFSSTSTQV